MRLLTLWQKIQLHDNALRQMGAKRRERLSLLLQKAAEVTLGRQKILRALYEATLEPVLFLVLKSARGSLLKGQSYWNRSSEFEPAQGHLADQETLHFPQFDCPSCSILIPVYGKWQYTYRCLASILKNTKDIKYEVIVLDDASTDETCNLSTVVKGVTFIRQPLNLGFLNNCNTGAKYAKGQTLVFLNNDTHVEPGWLRALHDALEFDDRVGLVGAKLLHTNGQLQEAGGIVWKEGSAWNFGRNSDPERPEYNYLKEVDYCSGACLLIPRNLWERLNGFNEQYAPAYYEDTDLAFRVRNLGLKCVYQPRAKVIHLEGVSHGKDTGSGTKRYQINNRQIFLQHWAHDLQKDHAEPGRSLFGARDRSAKKPHILIVDGAVPSWDTNAGGRLTFMYTKLFTELGYAVHFAPANLVCVQPYTERLQGHGIEVLYGHYYGLRHQEWLKQNGRYLKFVYLHRPHVANAYLPLIGRYAPQAKVLYQCHDLHFLRAQRAHEISGARGVSSKVEQLRDLEMSVFKRVDQIHTPSFEEKNWIQEELPTADVKQLPVYYWDDCFFNEPVPQHQGRSGLLFVGGARHSPNTDGLHWFLQEVWPVLRRDHPCLVLTIVGLGHENLSNRYEGMDLVGYVSDGDLRALYCKSILAIVPIRYGAGTNGKTVEALAYGLPVVSTSVGLRGLPQAPLLPNASDDPVSFKNSVTRLVESDSCWAQESANGREIARTYFSRSQALASLGLEKA